LIDAAFSRAIIAGVMSLVQRPNVIAFFHSYFISNQGFAEITANSLIY